MPRPTKALGLCALALALVTPTPSSDVVRAGARATETTSARSAASAARTARCTTWYNTVVPPETIRVWRQAYGPAEGTVQTVPFRKWTEYVLGTQMPGYYPTEALRANAIAVKQYGWYYVLHWRGGHAPNGQCYDVADTGDGFYRPEVYQPSSAHLRAVAATWPVSLRKRDWQTGLSRMFLTGYRAGAFVECGEDSDGFRLYQHSAHDCGRDGHTWEGILRKYMEPNLEIVQPRRTNVTGSIFGDATAMTNAVGRSRPRIFASTGSAFEPVPATSFDIDPARTLGIVGADVTNDGLSDLVVLQRVGQGAKLLVLRSDGNAYAAPRTWWADSQGIGRRELRLVAGDFDGDGIADAGLVAREPGGDRATFYVLRALGSKFGTPTRYWNGPMKLHRVRVYGADPTGDGRADLLIERDLDSDGLEYLVAASRLKGGALSNPVRWLRAGDVRRQTTRTAIGDYDRDGRDDVLLTVPNGTGLRIFGLKADRRTSSDFHRETLWTSPRSNPIAIRRVKMSAGDVTSDGRADVILWIDNGALGTRLIRLRVNDAGNMLSAADWLDDRTLDWDLTRPY